MWHLSPSVHVHVLSSCKRRKLNVCWRSRDLALCTNHQSFLQLTLTLTCTGTGTGRPGPFYGVFYKIPGNCCRIDGIKGAARPPLGALIPSNVFISTIGERLMQTDPCSLNPFRDSLPLSPRARTDSVLYRGSQALGTDTSSTRLTQVSVVIKGFGSKEETSEKVVMRRP